MHPLQRMESELSALKTRLKTHKVYQRLSNIADIRLFMEHHVFAVWDFMSLLKALQAQLTHVATPWVPAPNPALTRLVNEIVLAEESDVDELGQPKSHFQMYLEAMEQIGANTSEIHALMRCITSGSSVHEALNGINLDRRVSDFVRFSFEVIHTQQPHLMASAFTFGREDIIPDMFVKLLKQADPETNITQNSPTT